jgi:parvulin-like peptidyl-prolyl isomerase
LCVPALHVVAQTKKAQAPAPVATVGTRRVERHEFDTRLRTTEQQLAARRGEMSPEMRDVIQRQLLETLIRMNLLVLESQRLSTPVSTAEAESALKLDPFFSPGGQFDAAKWNLTRSTQAARFQSALATSRERVGARKLEDQVQARYRPRESDLRDQALRQLRRAFTEDVSLRVADFDGKIHEPRETDVLAYYARNKEQFRLTERAVLSVSFINEPPRTRLEQQDAAAGAAWTARMKRTADSVLAAIQRGASLEDATSAFGGPRGEVSVLPENFPSYWKGSPAQTASVFKAKSGQMLSEPIPGPEGFLVVRVDEVMPSHVPALRHVSRDIRARLRQDARVNRDEWERRALYAEVRDSLAGPAWRLRWTAIDTGTVKVPEPSQADLDRWYRGHLADFSSFDAKSGTIVARTLPEVKDEVRLRWKRDKRLETARLQANALYEAWSANKRASDVERHVRVRETPPLPVGARVDTGLAAAALSDTVWGPDQPRPHGLVAYPRGFLVWQVSGTVAKHTPSYEQVEGTLQAALDAERLAAEEQGARALYERDPKRFGLGRRWIFTRLTVAQPPIQDIKLTRAEVEHWHKRNIERYSAPELVRVKHILISPINASPAADRAARTRADSLLARIRAGESFDALAAQYSDDPPTKDKGGDVGVFRRGSMLPAFEEAAFAMEAGDLGGPVRTEVGYHILQCTEHVPEYIQPLRLVYSIVASDLARSRADTVAMRRADSLLRVARTIPALKSAGEKMGLSTFQYTYAEDEPMDNTSLVPYFEQLLKMKQGQVMPTKFISKGEGWWITWVDSIAPPVDPTWAKARGAALAEYRAGAGERAMLAKVAEMDSLEARGWSLDSLGAMWGGLTRSKELSATAANANASLPVAMDSLVFGLPGHPPALAPGQVSPWVRWPGGVARVRLLERTEPTEDRTRARMNDLRRAAVERQMVGYYEDLKKRYPVKIVDKKLDAIPLPEPPPEE